MQYGDQFGRSEWSSYLFLLVMNELTKSVQDDAS